MSFMFLNSGFPDLQTEREDAMEYWSIVTRLSKQK